MFLHYVLDLWFHKKWRPNVPEGEAIIVRYADDIVVGFQYMRDAERYLRDIRERLTQFGLSLHQDKTRLVEFGRFALLNRRQRGVGKPETFDFLGFTQYCTTTRRGRFRLGRKPIAKRVNRTLARIDEVLRKRWHHDIWEVDRWLGRVCEGWLNYFAVPGSDRFIRAFHRRLQRLWMRALRRRSQRARFGWRRLERMTEILWVRLFYDDHSGVEATWCLVGVRPAFAQPEAVSYDRMIEWDDARGTGSFPTMYAGPSVPGSGSERGG